MPYLPMLSHLVLPYPNSMDGRHPLTSFAHAYSQLRYLEARCLHEVAPLPMTRLRQLSILGRCNYTPELIAWLTSSLPSLTELRLERLDHHPKSRISVLTALAPLLISVSDGGLLARELALFPHLRHAYLDDGNPKRALATLPLLAPLAVHIESLSIDRVPVAALRALPFIALTKLSIYNPKLPALTLTEWRLPHLQDLACYRGTYSLTWLSVVLRAFPRLCFFMVSSVAAPAPDEVAAFAEEVQAADKRGMELLQLGACTLELTALRQSLRWLNLRLIPPGYESTDLGGMS